VSGATSEIQAEQERLQREQFDETLFRLRDTEEALREASGEAVRFRSELD